MKKSLANHPQQLLEKQKDARNRDHNCSVMLDLLFPRYCTVCAAPDPTGICPSCLPELFDVHTHTLLTPEPTPLLSCGSYSTTGMQSSIHAAKFFGEQDILFRIGRYVSGLQEVRTFLRGTALVPLPLHPLRQYERGYNQSVRFAEGLAHEAHYPIIPVLKRSGSLHQQSSLNTAEREKNPIVFMCSSTDQLSTEQSITVIDDVCTSGNTLIKSIAALRAAGYKNIRCLVCAIG